MDTFTDLLRLYSRHSTAEIESGGALLLRHFGVPDSDALLAIEGYTEAFPVVSRSSALLDKFVARYPEPRSQAPECIRLVRSMIDGAEPPRDIEAMRTLVEGRLYEAWPQPVKDFYDVKKAILEWRDFFVSYTNRDAPATNSQFQLLIRTSLGKVPKSNENKVNWVARVIARHLRRSESLVGFFDESDMQVGDDIQNGVDKFCRRTFALVQLIEPMALDREPPKNWCFYEYSRFTANPAITALMGDKDRHFFVVAGGDLDSVRPANLSPAYKAWCDRIDRLLVAKLELERNTTLRAKVKEIAKRIVAVRAEIIDAWLSDSQ